jgi:hypothetical protein
VGPRIQDCFSILTARLQAGPDNSEMGERGGGDVACEPALGGCRLTSSTRQHQPPYRKTMATACEQHFRTEMVAEGKTVHSWGICGWRCRAFATAALLVLLPLFQNLLPSVLSRPCYL